MRVLRADNRRLLVLLFYVKTAWLTSSFCPNLLLVMVVGLLYICIYYYMKIKDKVLYLEYSREIQSFIPHTAISSLRADVHSFVIMIIDAEQNTKNSMNSPPMRNIIMMKYKICIDSSCYIYTDENNMILVLHSCPKTELV